MHKILSQRPLTPPYLSLLDGVATLTDDWAEAEGVVAGAATLFNEALFATTPKLRVVSRIGIGIDNVDVAAATRYGVAVCNAPDAPTISTAEHALALLLAVAKQIKVNERRVVGEKRPFDFFGHNRGVELFGKTLGVVGLGRIGRHMSRLGQGLGMRVIGYDPFANATELEPLGIALLPTLEALLTEADAVTLHLPRTPETVGLMNATTLRLMKPGSILINAARGGIVDEAALLAVLEDGHLLGAGLDVFDVEPPASDHPLLLRPDVVVSPHIASGTDLGKHKMMETAVLQVIQFLQGIKPPHLINPEVWRQG